MTLAEDHSALKERWKTLRAEMENCNYDWVENGLAMWVEAKTIQFGVIFSQPILKKLISVQMIY